MITNNSVKKCKVTKKQLEIIGLMGIFTKNKMKKAPLPKIILLVHIGG